MGDLLTQAKKDGGLAISTSSSIFLTVILLLAVYLTKQQKEQDLVTALLVK